MSYDEYRDLFIKAQNNSNAPYMCFSFDLKNSKNMDNNERYLAQKLTFETINLFTKKILDLQKQENRNILLKNDEIKICKNMPVDRIKLVDITYYSNPCFTAGDSFHYYTYNNSITEEEFISLFKESLFENSNYFTYHFASGKFETTNSGERNKKYYVGYIICELTDNKSNRKYDITIDNELSL